MTGFDWVIVAIIVLSILAAAAEGFFFELFSLGGAILGFLLASWEYWRLAPYFEPHVKSTAVANAAGFLVIMVFTIVIASVVGKLARWAMEEVGLRWIDRLLGAAFGVLRGGVVVTALVLALTTFLPQAQWLERSELARYFLLTARVASWTVPGEVRARFLDGVALLRKAHMQAGSPANDQHSANDERH